MNFEIMQRLRLKWVRELGTAGRPMASEQSLAAYHRGFMDAVTETIEAAVRACHDTPTTLCQNGEFMSERCAKAVRALLSSPDAAQTPPQNGSEK
jgi:beta-glucosidase/6-phospho-beta-glucosidase/beta-galactosidase